MHAAELDSQQRTKQTSVASAAPPARIERKASISLPNNPIPKYPSLARRRGYEGKVMLEVQVNAAGTAGNIKVPRSSGYKVLDQAAVKTVKRWRFEPALHSGSPVSSVVEIPVIFRLEEAGE